MNTRLRTSLIIAAMVTLCMVALPGVADQRAAISGATALSFDLPINDSGARLAFTVSEQTLAQISADLGDALIQDCEVNDPPAESSSRFPTVALTSGFEMPFFSVAGLLGGAVSQ
ncbi:MAG: hypothetical protein KDI71_10510 [Xanthomonadales bacterium]|nr:hypothetical protein [Xanthomonadales bacterium]